ncbi:MAG TPA: P1 family peptidase, partial [Ramlibacter sp.]|nr:P1 family peptidase [Ramlibacter sp.]
RSLPTVNPLVFECNDGFLNDIQRMAVTPQHYLQAFDAADEAVVSGAVGAGRGMSCFELKGGIGTASRRVMLRGGAGYTVGALVLANFGKLAQLRIDGHAVGERLAAATPDDAPEQGSIILLLATDAPLDARQLRRLALRAGAGLARTGSVFGHGSGDIALAFSTAYTVPQAADAPMPAVAMLHDGLLDQWFQAAADGSEQAIYDALWQAHAVTGRDGHRRDALADSLKGWTSLSPAAPSLLARAAGLVRRFRSSE